MGQPLQQPGVEHLQAVDRGLLIQRANDDLVVVVRNTPVAVAPLSQVLSPACQRLTFVAHADEERICRLAHPLLQEKVRVGDALLLEPKTGFVFEKAVLHECNYNWKTFIEVYLEDYHVGPFHPGLGSFVTCDDLRWEFGAEHSVQTVGVHDQLRKSGSAAYRRWQEAVLQYRNGKPPEHGAIWLTYYPTVMVEWYPHVLVVSSLFPKGPRKTLNLVEFFYPEEIAAFEREFVDAQQAAYMETCVEDDEIAERMDAGRKALMERGDNEVGPYQSPMEDGMQHFHEWYRARIPAASIGG